MADGLLFNTAGKILEALGSRIFQEIGLAYGVQDEISELKETVDTIHGVLLDAEEQQGRNNQAVTVWLRRLKETVYAADDLLDDLSTDFLRRNTMRGNKVMKEVRIFFSKYNQFAYALKMGHQIKATRKRLESIKNDRQFHLTERRIESRVENTSRETHSFVRAEDIIGRDDDKNELISRLLDSNDVDAVSVIPIVGIGGVGKSAVAQLVYNDDKIKKHFDLRIWVCVSHDFVVTTIVEKIIASTTNSEGPRFALDKLQERLRVEIEGKKYLLVLDDVWNENRVTWLKFETLLMNGERGSKIIVTTRSEVVAKITTNKLHFHTLKGLSEDMSWSLFTRMAFERGIESEDSEVTQIGKNIVAKCKGVPLAIGTIGRLLHHQNTKAFWLSIQNNELSNIAGGDNGI